MTSGQTRASLITVRERHVRYYLNHLSALSAALTRPSLSPDRDYVDARAISRDLMDHAGEFAHHIETLRPSLLSIAAAAGGEDDDTLRDFAHSLADETIESILSQVRVDTHRARRLAIELAMAVLLEAPKSERAYRAIVANFLRANLYRIDSQGRHLKSERFIRATLNTAIFRAHNESVAYSSPVDSFILERDGHVPIAFKKGDYAEIVGTLHPFAEPIVLVDLSVTDDV